MRNLAALGRALAIGALLGFPIAAQAEPLRLEKIDEGVYAVVGDLGNRSPENLGNNATFGFVVTDEGVVLIDPGGSSKGAARLHALIESVTDQPVKLVINTGGQDHRWLGNGYFKERGAEIIANQRAVADQRARVRDQLIALENLLGPGGLDGTEAVYADRTFDDSMTLSLGAVDFELHFSGHAHTPGDSFVWLPKQRILFTGDTVYVQRMLGVLGVSKSSTWVASFEQLEALEPRIVVPGHGHVTGLAEAKADTYDYLVFLRQAVAAFMEAGGGIEEVGKIDQSRFGYLDNYETLKGRNAQRVYEELEWE